MNKALVADIVQYLEKNKSAVASDDQESLEIAIETLTEVFGVSAGSNDLQAIYERGVAAGAGSLGGSVGGSAPDSGTATPRLNRAASPTPEAKAQAEAKKQEGNREMAHKNYEQAIELYSAAIALNPHNTVYYSNRAAAYSQVNKPSLAVADARHAISLDPGYSKAYSRLGLALYALGDTQGSLHAYEQGLKAEGEAPSEGMKRGYETVKSRIATESSKISKTAGAEEDTERGASPDFGAGFGGLGGFGDLLKNPEIRNMASNMMKNPGAMANLMNSPAAQNLRNQFGGEGGAGAGGMPDFSKLMNDPNISKMMNDPMIQNMAKQFMGN